MTEGPARSIHDLWRIELFGGLRVIFQDRVITRFPTERAGMLLAYLAFYAQRAHPREKLVELLWPECEIQTGIHRLRQALTSLRRQLESRGAAVRFESFELWSAPQRAGGRTTGKTPGRHKTGRKTGHPHPIK